MAQKQTSARISGQAARLLAKLPKRGRIAISEGVRCHRNGYWWFAIRETAMPVATLRSILASAISQDETPQPKKAKRRRGLR